MLLICFSFAPPSYYHTHTPEEIDADYRHVKELISHFDDKDEGVRTKSWTVMPEKR